MKACRWCWMIGAVLVLAAGAFAQEPPPEDPAATVEVSAEPEGGTKKIEIPIEAPLSGPDVNALAKSAANNAEAVSNGDATIAEATRDPAKAPDPGEGSTFWLLSLIFGGVIRPIVNIIVDKVSAVDPRLSGSINTGVVVAFYIGAWAILASNNPGLPQDWTSWLVAGFAATGVGSLVSSGQRSIASMGRS